MKIAFLVTCFPCLSETFILNQITGLIDRGHEVDIYAYERSNDPKIHEDVEKYNLLNRTIYYGESEKNIPVSRIVRLVKGFELLIANYKKNPRAFIRSMNIIRYKKKAANLKLLYMIVPFVGRGDYDVIQCHFGPNGNRGVILKDLGVFTGKIITVFHGYDITQYIHNNGRDAYKYLFDKGDFFLPISQRWKNELISLGCRKEKIMVHRMGIDVEKYNDFHRNTKGDDKLKIITIARFVEKKGIRYGVEAVGQVVKEHPEIEYRIIGDGPLRDEIESVIDQLKLREKIKLLGWKSEAEILKYMNDSDILLLSSVTSNDGDQEGIPVVLMEAMAMGLPVVSTFHSGIPELVQDGISGFLAPERDVSGLAKKLRHCIEHPELWPSILKEAHNTIIQNYNIDDLNDRLVMIYQQLLDSHRDRFVSD